MPKINNLIPANDSHRLKNSSKIANLLTEISLGECAAIHGGHGRPLFYRDKSGVLCRRALIGGGYICRSREPGVD